MKCPFCNHLENKVLETRSQKSGEIRRRRQCLKCQQRFSTLETHLSQLPHVRKKDGRREPFNKDKLRKGVQLSCIKRPVSLVEVENLVTSISEKVLSQGEQELSTLKIGQLVMEQLKTLDDVAYVRFASVYKTFADVQEFVEVLNITTPINKGPTSIEP